MQKTTSSQVHLSFVRRLERITRLIVITAVAVGGMSWAQTPQVALAAGSITGNVFQDFNNNGVKDTSGANNTAVDRGVQGVTVSAYDAGGVQRGTATTDGNGNYTLTATGSGPYRIEFTTLPATFAQVVLTLDDNNVRRYVASK